MHDAPSGSLASTRTISAKIAERLRPSQAPALQLRAGFVVRNALSGRAYRVGQRLGVGGFGAAYLVTHLTGTGPLLGKCALKVAAEPRGWHREAYFGDLLKDVSGVVKIHESFAWTPRGKARKPLYCLISEHIGGGDLGQYLERYPKPWPESKARREIIRLLRAVTLLHDGSAVHRDITPRNVFVAPGTVLKLGDFGIALHRVGERYVPADAFNPWFAPQAILEGKGKTGKPGSWRPSDDVYQLGQLYAVLLRGGAKSKLTAGDVKKLGCTAQAKAVIQRCIGQRGKRFANAQKMLSAFEKHASDARPPTVRTLRGKRVVFTGPMPIPRATAVRLLRRAGGSAENRVSQQTDVVVVGDQSPAWKAEKKGQKLLDVDHELELGHKIAVISGARFLALAGAKAQLGRRVQSASR